MTQTFELLKNAILRKGEQSTVPFYEHIIDPPIIKEIQTKHFGWDMDSIEFSEAGEKLYWQRFIEFYRQMGYNFVPIEFPILFAPPVRDDVDSDYDTMTRGFINENEGPIKTWDDLENPELWKSIDDVFNYDTFFKVADLVPDEMKIIGGASGGPFEHASFLLGLEPLCMAIYDDEKFVEALFNKIGYYLVEIAKKLLTHQNIGAYRFGDDLGYKSATMLAPNVLRHYVFPWQKAVVETVHANNRPFVLHSCGHLTQIMDDLIDDVKIDAKHSTEDIIMPITEAKQIWGNRVALLGGIDVDFLCRSSIDEIKDYTKRTMEICAKGGGYAVGSGNTIASYVPIDNYMAMIQAANEFNGR